LHKPVGGTLIPVLQGDKGAPDTELEVVVEPCPESHPTGSRLYTHKLACQYPQVEPYQDSAPCKMLNVAAVRFSLGWVVWFWEQP